MLRAEWSGRRAEELHEELDALVIESDIGGEDLLSSAALELSTCLCSLVDAQGGTPNPAQQRRWCSLSTKCRRIPGALPRRMSTRPSPQRQLPRCIAYGA
jgi:hypothetical protein